MSRNGILQRFAALNVWEKGSQRAPHKPLMVLLALGRLQLGERWLFFNSIDRKFRILLQTFGPPRRQYHSEYPFWWLQTDGVWQVPSGGSLVRRSGKTSEPKRSELVIRNVKAGFSQEVYEALRSHPRWVADVARLLLDGHFPESLHDQISNSVGLTLLEDRGSIRDPAFREVIIRVYEHRCAICGYDVKLSHMDLGLDAAHIMWRAAGGPDRVTNGLALCGVHHRAFDLGALSLSLDRTVMVSEHVHGGSLTQELFLNFLGSPIRTPLKSEYKPGECFIEWHQREVFRGPCRA